MKGRGTAAKGEPRSVSNTTLKLVNSDDDDDDDDDDDNYDDDDDDDYAHPVVLPPTCQRFCAMNDLRFSILMLECRRLSICPVSSGCKRESQTKVTDLYG